MKRFIPILMMLLLLTGCGAQSSETSYRQITMEEAVTMMEEETGYTILDVRTAQEYSEKHIPGAINIANESIGTEDIPELPDNYSLNMLDILLHVLQKAPRVRAVHLRVMKLKRQLKRRFEKP